MPNIVGFSTPTSLLYHSDNQVTGIHTQVTASALPQRAVGAWAESLRITLQAQAMTEYLGPLLGPLAAPESEVRIQAAQLLDGKPSHRALIKYELAGTTDGQGRIVFGKVYAEPSQAVRVYEAMRYLWHEVFSTSIHLSIPQPLGIIPELSMLVYLPSEGHFLDEAINPIWRNDIADHQATDWMALAGQWLAHLHQHPFALEKQFQLTTELTNAAAWAALVNQAFPETAPATARIFEHLQTWASRVQFTTQTPIHKDFHYRHIITNRLNRQLTVIDFDEIRLGDPAFDLAHFCTNLHLLHYRTASSLHENPHQLTLLQRTFLDAYTHQTGWVKDQRFVCFSLYTCLKIAKQLCTGRGPDPRPVSEEQRRQVQMILDQGAYGEW